MHVLNYLSVCQRQSEECFESNYFHIGPQVVLLRVNYIVHEHSIKFFNGNVLQHSFFPACVSPVVKNIEPCRSACLSVLVLVSRETCWFPQRNNSNMFHETSNSPAMLKETVVIDTFALCEDSCALIGSIFISLFFTHFYWLRTSCSNYQVIWTPEFSSMCLGAQINS